jgi:hypothetical protein
MDITKAKKVVRLSKEGREVFVTLWEGDKISSCVQEQETKQQYCETCEGNEVLCSQFIDYLKEKGYEATEVPLGELAVEESLPRFLEERAKPEVTESVEE